MSADEWVYDPLEWATDNGSGDDMYPPVTQVIEEGHVLRSPIEQLLIQADHRTFWSQPIYMVTDHRWSGYSEYTITSTWSEVHIHHGEADLHYDDMGAFIRALADANPPGSRS